MALIRPAAAVRTLGPTFSFYVPSTNPAQILTCAAAADATVVHGASGPTIVSRLRREGFGGVVLFDRADYERHAKPVAPNAWFDAQREAGADRILTAGRWVEWDLPGDALSRALEAAHAESSEGSGATLLLALDSRWITNSGGLDRTIDTLAQVSGPVALVLSHRDDPLGSGSAINNLLALIRNVRQLSFLRSDHGAIGAVALGAAHGSIGLVPRYRHFVPPSITSGGRPQDRTARVFVRDLMDWFTGLNIAGWGAAGVNLNCRFPCCNGQSLARFLDHRLSADDHNRTVLALLAVHILDADPSERLGAFSLLCNGALEHYGPMGKLSDVTKPKDQLMQWAQFPYAPFR